MIKTFKNKGFTLAELLMAVWVMSIILASVAALSFALGTANDSVGESSEIYSKIRYTTMRLGEIVKNSKLICTNKGIYAAIWTADRNNNGKIEPGELVYIETGIANDRINLVSYEATGAAATTQVALTAIVNNQARLWLKTNCQEKTVTLIDNCSYVYITTDRTGTPWSFSKKFNIIFGIAQNGVDVKYEFTEYLRCWAGYLLDSNGRIVSSDDD